MDVFDNMIAQYGMPWLIGQIFGIVAIIFGFVTYQMKTQTMVLMMQGVVALSFVYTTVLSVRIPPWR